MSPTHHNPGPSICETQYYGLQVEGDLGTSGTTTILRALLNAAEGFPVLQWITLTGEVTLGPQEAIEKDSF